MNLDGMTIMELQDLRDRVIDETYRRLIADGAIKLTDAEVFLLGAGKKIHAIKSVRARICEGNTYMSLRNAKSLVETYEANIRRELAGTGVWCERND